MKRRSDRSRIPAAVLALAVAGLSAAAAAGADDAAWPMFRGESGGGGVAGAGLPGDLDVRWTFPIGSGTESTAAIVGGTVYAVSLDGVLYAIDLASGQARWEYAGGEETKSSPSVRDGVVYFGDESGTLHAVDAATGKRRWTFQAESGIVSSVNFSGDRLLFGSYDNHLYCLTRDGKLAWKVETEGYVHGTPAVVSVEKEPWVISAGCDGYLRAVRVADGTEVGRTPLGGYVAASPAVQGDRAFVGTFENQVLGIDLRTRAIAWTFEDADRKFPFYSSPAVRGDLLVIGGRDKFVRALDPRSGAEKWTFAAGARVDASPVIAGNRAVIASTRGEVVLLDLKSGEPAWRFDTGGAILASPAVGAGSLVIGTAEGALFCFGAPAAATPGPPAGGGPSHPGIDPAPPPFEGVEP